MASVLGPARAKLIFRIVVSRRTQAEYHDQWERRRDRQLADLGISPAGPDERVTGAELSLWADDPPTYPYNDLLGFVEVYWDGGTKIMAHSYFLGDGRLRPGRALRAQHRRPLNARKFYLFHHAKWLAYLRQSASDDELRAALLDALDVVEEEIVQQQGGRADLAHVCAVASNLDVRNLLWPRDDEPAPERRVTDG